MKIRAEKPRDIEPIGDLTTAAFTDMAYCSHTEAAIIDALRTNGSLTLSLVAEDAGKIVGHVAFSPVLIDGSEIGWYGLGPIAVRPDRQGEGIGSALIGEGLARLRESGAKGCVVLGDPGYYARFGFAARSDLMFPGVPPQYFQALAFGSELPLGEVAYDAAFAAV